MNPTQPLPGKEGFKKNLPYRGRYSGGLSTFAAMIVYNETFIVEPGVYTEWLAYMRETHIPAVMATGYFGAYKILNVIDSPNEGVTTCIQYSTDTEEKFAKFYNEHLHKLHTTHQQLYENKFVLYNTLMETIAEG